MNKGDFSSAHNTADTLGAGRGDWKALLLKLIDLYQEPAKIYTLKTDTSYKNFMLNYASTDGKDGQGIAQALLKFVCGNDYPEPRPLPGSSEGGRIMQQTVANRLNYPAENLVLVYPNPAQNAVTIYYNGQEQSNAFVEVKDLLGKIIYTNFIRNGEENSVSLSGYSNGVYIITVTENKELIYKTKLVKQD